MDIILSRILALVGKKHGAKKELCDAINIKPNTVTEWEKGRSKSYPKYAPQIAAYYGVSLDWLTGLSDIKNPPAVSDEGKLNEELISLLCQMNQDQLDQAESFLKWLLSNPEK